MAFGRDPLRFDSPGRERGTAAQAETLNPIVLAKAERLLAEYEPSLDSFIDLYSPGEIARDKERVQKIETTFNKERGAHAEGHTQDEDIKRAATVFEAMAFEGIRAHGWLGNDAAPFKTTRYDDYVHGVDLVAEVPRGDNSAEHLALAIDVTFGKRSQEKKFVRIRESILQERLGEVKYFHSERAGANTPLSMVPRVVIGIEPRNVIRMSQLWANDEKKLAILPAQMAMLQEIEAQLEAFSLFARNHNKMAAISAYRQAKAILANILKEKRETARYQTLDDDRVYQAILESARTFNR